MRSPTITLDTDRSVYRTAVMEMICKRRFPTRRTRDTFGASVISTVTALAESENRRKETGADARNRKRQFADVMRVALKMPVFVGVSENCGKDSLPPSQVRTPGRELLQPQHFQAFPPPGRSSLNENGFFAAHSSDLVVLPE